MKPEEQTKQAVANFQARLATDQAQADADELPVLRKLTDAMQQEIESLMAQRDALADAAARLYAAINLASIPAESLDNYLREPMNEVFTALRAAGRLS